MKEIDEHLELLEVHLPYHDSDSELRSFRRREAHDNLRLTPLGAFALGRTEWFGGASCVNVVRVGSPSLLGTLMSAAGVGISA